MMKHLRVLLVFAIAALPTLAFAAGGLHTTTSTSTGTSSTSTVSLTIPGIVGIDIESDAAFDFSNYLPGQPTDASCLPNRWPPSVVCASSATIHLDPMTASNTLGTTTTTGLAGAAPSAAANDTAIWMAVFCSRAGTANTFAVTGAIDVPVTTSGLTYQNFVSKASGTNNGKGIGFGSFTAFTTNNSAQSISGSSGLGITFPWTRVDQAVALEFPANTALTETATSTWGTLTYAVSKP